jgi:hypothetical protein
VRERQAAAAVPAVTGHLDALHGEAEVRYVAMIL